MRVEGDIENIKTRRSAHGGPRGQGALNKRETAIEPSQGRCGSLKSHLAIPFKNVWQLPFLSNMNRARMGPGVEILEASRRQGLLEGLLEGLQEVNWVHSHATQQTKDCKALSQSP